MHNSSFGYKQSPDLTYKKIDLFSTLRLNKSILKSVKPDSIYSEIRTLVVALHYY